MSESIEKTIDIDKILKSKMGSKVKFVPRFLVSWLKKIIHEDEVNRFLWESRGLSGTEWLTECVRYLKMDVEIVGLETCLTRTTANSIPLFPIILWADRTVYVSVPSSASTMMASSAIW